jgi:hypothetical protein
MASRQKLIDCAMRLLKSSDSDARKLSIEIAEDYRKATGPLGVYNRAGKFSELRQRLRKEVKDARNLAQFVNAATAAAEVAITHLLRVRNLAEVDQQKIDGSVWQRRELVRDLKQFADNTDMLIAELPWPKGGDWDLAKAHLGSPNRWLVNRCLQVFFRYGDTQGIRPLSTKQGKQGSPFGDYVKAIYEFATGKCPEGAGVGLEKTINQVARAWRKREKRSAILTTTPPK